MNWFPDETSIKQLTTNQVLFDHHETWNLSYLHYLFQHFHPRRSSSESSERAEIIILQSFSLTHNICIMNRRIIQFLSNDSLIIYLTDEERKVVTNGIFTVTNDSETRHASSAVISSKITVNKESQRCDEPLFDSDFCLWT